MSTNKTLSKFLAMLVSVAMLLGTVPITAIAEGIDSGASPGYSVTGFAALDEAVAAQSVPRGTAMSALNLPDTLIATGSAISVATPSDTTEEPPQETGITISGVTWQAAPEYEPDTEGTYSFTAALPQEYDLAGGAVLPVITVTVETGELDEEPPIVTPAITFDIPLNEYGETAFYLTEGEPITDADLLAGVTATDENGSDVLVTVKDIGGLDMQSPQLGSETYPNIPYVITYAAEHPVTGEPFTKTRDLYITLGISKAMAGTENFQVEGGDVYETLEEAAANVPDGGTITMLQDVTMPKDNPDALPNLDHDKTYTIDLGGNTLDNGLIKITAGIVTIKNGTINNPDFTFCVFVDGGNVTLQDLTVDLTIHSSHLYMGGAVTVYSGTLTILNGTYKSNYIALLHRDGTIWINTGTFKNVPENGGDCITTVNPDNIIYMPYSNALHNPTNGEITVTGVSADKLAYLRSLSYKVDGGTAITVPSFSAKELTYNVALPSETDPSASIELLPTKIYEGVKITANSGVTLSNGEGTATVVVQSKDGTATRTYTVNFSKSTLDFETGGNLYFTLEEAAAAVENDGTITMLRDVELFDLQVLGINKTYIIDLGGHTLSREDTALTINGGAVTIQNGSITSRDSIAIEVLNGTVLIRCDKITGSQCALYCGSGGTVTIMAGRFISTFSDEDGCIVANGSDLVKLAEGSSANKDPWLNIKAVTDVTITSVADANNNFLSALFYKVDGGPAVSVPDFSPFKTEYNVTVPVIEGSSVAIEAIPTKMVGIAAIVGTLTTNLASGTQTITITVRSQSGSDRTYKVNFTATYANFKTGGNYYLTLGEAIAAVEDGGTITMLHDVNLSANVTLSEDKAYTLDLGGHTLSFDNGSIYIYDGTKTIKNGNITSTAYATIRVNSGSVSIADVVITGDHHAVHCSGGTIIFISGRFVCMSDETARSCIRLENTTGQVQLSPDSEPSVYPWWNNNSVKEVVVTRIADDENAYLSVLTYSVDNGPNVDVQQDFLNGFNYNISLPASTSQTANITLAATPLKLGASITQNDGISLVNGTETATIEVTAGDGSTKKTYTVSFKVKEANFQIGDEVYATLGEAVAAVQDGETIVMLKDIGISSPVYLNSDKTYTLDFGDHTLSRSGITDYFLVIEEGTVTVQNGTLDNSINTAIGIYGANVTFSDLTTSPISVSSGTLSILSGTYNSLKCDGGTVTIEAGTFGKPNSSYTCLATSGSGQIELARGSEADVDPWLNNNIIWNIIITPSTYVAFTAEQLGGASGTAYSTGIKLTFDQAVSGLTADDITIADDTGAAAKGSLSGSGTEWTIALTDVTAEGDVIVTVADFPGYCVEPSYQNVAVYKRLPALVTAAAIGGITDPAYGGAPDTAITPATQYTGAVGWNPADVTFGYDTAYTATITLTAEEWFTFSGGFANIAQISGFTVNGIAPEFVENTGATLKFSVTFPQTEPAPTYGVTLDQTGTYAFTADDFGYTAPGALSVTVNNSGNQPTGALTVALSGAASSDFTLSKTDIDSIAVSGSDSFTVQPKAGLPAGGYNETVTVAGNNGITASFDVSFTVNQKNLSGITVTATIPNETYTGSARTPIPTEVQFNGMAVVSGTDYTLGSYLDNTDAGTARLEINGFGNYTGTATVSFTIDAKDLSGVSVTATFPTVAYTGSALTPAPTQVQFDGSNVASGVDYTLGLYSNNINAGNASLVINGTGNYTGSQTVNFTIDRAVYGGNKSASAYVRANQVTPDLMLTLPTLPPGAGYSSSGTLGGTTALISGHSVAGTTLTYSVASQADSTTATITIDVTGATNYLDYSVEVMITATVKTPVTISGVSITGAGKTYNGAAVSYTGNPIAHDGNGNVTISSYDYEWKTQGGTQLCAAPKDAGDYILIVSVPDTDANYAGSQTISFSINKATIIITPENKNALVGDAEPSYTYKIIGLASGESLATPPTLICTPDMNTAGTYPISASGAVAPDSGINYNAIQYGSGILTVLQLNKEATPSAVIDFSAEKLTGLVAGAKYTISGAEYTADASGCIAIRSSWINSTISIVRKGDGTTSLDSEAMSLSVPARQTSPATPVGGIGRITGVTTAMEYKLLSASSWSACTSSTITGLAAGTYEVRYRAGAGQFASVSITVTVTEASGDNDSGNTGGTTTPTQPANTVNIVINGQTVKAEIGADGTLTLTYTASDINKYSDKSDVFDITVSGQDSVGFNIPISALGNDDLEIHTNFGTIIIPNATLQAIKALYGETLRLIISKGSFKVALLDGNKKEVAYNDPAHPFIIKLPYKLASGQKSGSVVAVDSKGDILPFGVYAKGLVTFEIAATGTYDVKYNAKTFTDISGHWAVDYIGFVAAREIFSGTGNSQFAPNGSMTRAMFAMALSNLDDANLSVYKTSRFGDVKAGEWYAAAVEWAADMGIVNGVGGGLFDPNAEITREQMAVMLYNYMKYKDYVVPTGMAAAFKDESQISTWAHEAVEVMQKMGVVSGKPGNLFDPQGVATRAEVATIFARFVESITGVTGMSTTASNAMTNSVHAMLPGKENEIAPNDENDDENEA